MTITELTEQHRSVCAAGRWEECRAELGALYEQLNQATDGTMHIDSEYLASVRAALT